MSLTSDLPASKSLVSRSLLLGAALKPGTAESRAWHSATSKCCFNCSQEFYHEQAACRQPHLPSLKNAMSQSLLYLPAQAMRPSLARSTLAQPSTLLLCARCSARQSPSILHSRQFTTARRNDAAMGEMQPVDNSSLAVFKQPSRKARMQKMAGKQLGQDLGRIPNALIMPAAKQLPKWLSRDFFKRFRILYLHLKSSVKDWVGYVTFSSGFAFQVLPFPPTDLLAPYLQYLDFPLVGCASGSDDREEVTKEHGALAENGDRATITPGVQHGAQHRKH